MNDYVKGYKQGKRDYQQGNKPVYSLDPSEDFQRGYNAGWDVAQNADDMKQQLDIPEYF